MEVYLACTPRDKAFFIPVTDSYLCTYKPGSLLHYLTFFPVLTVNWVNPQFKIFLMYCMPGHAWAWGQIQYWIMAKLSRKERLPKMVRKRFIALLSRHGESNDALGTRGYETITMQNDSLCGPICLGSDLFGKLSFSKNLEFWKKAFIIHHVYASKLLNRCLPVVSNVEVLMLSLHGLRTLD